MPIGLVYIPTEYDSGLCNEYGAKGIGQSFRSKLTMFELRCMIRLSMPRAEYESACSCGEKSSK